MHRSNSDYSKRPAINIAIQEIETNNIFKKLLGDNVKADYDKNSNIKFLGSDERVSFKIRATGNIKQKILYVHAINNNQYGWSIETVKTRDENQMITLYSSRNQ
ncbi:MAG: hypothetical protein HND53_01485 [Proteobacteria bacterium]|nr:hypothetical protein [Pseudomonadota bacterium]NOG59143.1 hypothetical protein [Pseudomonadota bacterium]